MKVSNLNITKLNYVDVAASPVVSSFTFERGLQVGDRVGVACIVGKGDSPISVNWEKDGKPLEELGLPDVSVTTISEISSFLLIARLKADHAGDYTCRAINTWAEHSHKATLNVNGTMV